MNRAKSYIIRLDKNIKFRNQTEMAKIIGIDNSRLSKIIRGKAKCDKATAMLITMIYDKTLKLQDYNTKYFIEIEEEQHNNE